MDKYIEYFSCRDDFYNAILDILSGDSNNDRANQIIDLFDDLPTADVQPMKRGRWITWDDSGFTKCSCCNSEYYISDLQVVGDSEGFVDFCPNCGARMDGDNNG